MINPKKNGRPVIVGGKPSHVQLDEESRATALMLGNGNVSAGIRIALRNARIVLTRRKNQPQ